MIYIYIYEFIVNLFVLNNKYEKFTKWLNFDKKLAQKTFDILSENLHRFSMPFKLYFVRNNFFMFFKCKNSLTNFIFYFDILNITQNSKTSQSNI